MSRQISVSDHKEPSRARISLESEKDKYSHFIREMADKAWAADVPWRHVRGFDLNVRWRRVARANEHFMASAAKVRVEPAFLEFVEHKMVASEGCWNARPSLCLIGSVCNLTHRLTRAEREDDKHRVYSTTVCPAGSKLGWFGCYCFGASAGAGWPVRRAWRRL
jgi:hypothetical protein